MHTKVKIHAILKGQSHGHIPPCRALVQVHAFSHYHGILKISFKTKIYQT